MADTKYAMLEYVVNTAALEGIKVFPTPDGNIEFYVNDEVFKFIQDFIVSYTAAAFRRGDS